MANPSSNITVYKNSAVFEVWSGPAGTFTQFNPDGSVATTRALTAGEVAALAAQDADISTAATNATNLPAVQQKARTALTNNQTYLAIASPTTAQAVAQVAALTRQVNALIYLALQDFSSTTGT